MVLVTGMHRSGTSCVSGILHLCGFSLGTVHPVSVHPTRDNRTGHYENLVLMTLNDRILNQAGGSWHTPPSPARVRAAPALRLITPFCREFDGELLKDPRMTLLIDHYVSQCDDLDAVVHCVRSPIAVAQSLHRRNSFPLSTGFALWEYYNSYFLSHVRKAPVVYVGYENLLSDPGGEIDRMISAVGKGTVTQQALDRVKNDLNHCTAAENSLDSLNRQVRDLHEDLTRKCTSGC